MFILGFISGILIVLVLLVGELIFRPRLNKYIEKIENKIINNDQRGEVIKEKIDIAKKLFDL